MGRYYIVSEEEPSYLLKEIFRPGCQSETVTYRRSIPKTKIKPGDLDNAQEVIERDRRAFRFDDENGITFEEIKTVEYDKEGERYFLTPKKLSDLEKLLEVARCEFVLVKYQLDSLDEDTSGYLEYELGFPLPEKDFHLIKFLDCISLTGNPYNREFNFPED